jgi:hypothetical protein
MAAPKIVNSAERNDKAGSPIARKSYLGEGRLTERLPAHRRQRPVAIRLSKRQNPP